MSRGRKRWWGLTLLSAALTASGCQKINLEVTAHGGFAYIRNSNGTVDLGFLKTVEKPECTVVQLGVDMRIDDGRIISPPNSPTTIDVSNAEVTFDGIGTGSIDLTGNGLKATSPTPPMPTQPTPRTNEDDWRDVYWVPRTRLHYLNTRIDPNWQQKKVDGFASLAGGSLSGGIPSDGAALQGVWEFKRESDGMSFKQAITDRTRFRTKLPGKTLIINVKRRNGSPEKYEVEPIDGRQTVGVILVGRHAENTPVTINPGDTIRDFCAFYEILEQVPPVKEQLIPRWTGPTTIIGSNAPTSTSNGQPSPGLFCPGDWP